jgi:hypothetical protein
VASNSRQMPVTALHTLADVSIGDQAEGTTRVPIRILARTVRPVFAKEMDPKLGPIVHDMAGMVVDRERVPLDYCHNSAEVLGYAEQLDTSTGVLTAVGMLTPFKPDDRASEVIYKGKECSVPYQASIFFDDQTCLAEEVPEGVTVTVNGADLVGPAIVIRQWSVRGIAVCPYGKDGDTELQFSDNPRRIVAVNFIHKESTQMADENTPETPAEDKPAKPSFEEFCTKLGIPADKLTEDGKKMLEEQYAALATEDEPPAEPPATPEEKPKPPMAATEFATLGQTFLTQFGAQGGVWFAEGLTLDQARTKFAATLQEENKSLAERLKVAEAKLASRRGETVPVSFSDSAPPPDAPNDQVSGRERYRASLEKKLAAGKR